MNLRIAQAVKDPFVLSFAARGKKAAFEAAFELGEPYQPSFDLL